MVWWETRQQPSGGHPTMFWFTRASSVLTFGLGDRSIQKLKGEAAAKV